MEKTPEIPKTYTASDWEGDLYRLWEESGFFNPNNIESDKRYCNVLPPPNANGELHLGHASGYTVMDIFGRFERMKGSKVLLLPGKDHAGIQTQVVFEKKIKEERGLSRYDLGREAFYEECYAFCLDRAHYMRSQEKRIGLSADWSREKFTLDPEVSAIAMETFVKMHEDGLIYRGDRIINWCPRCATALSDVEVVHKETIGNLYHIAYPFKDSKESIVVATTRPETMLGDTAVAVHPDDPRYTKFIGKTLILPLVQREIPVIADERIDKAFGTGAVKITPAHDPLDWKIGKDHHLEEIRIINEHARITKEGGKYEDLPVHEARTAILKALEAAGALEKTEEISLNISQCERCKTVIEPLISKQWFVNVDAPKHSLKQKALDALKDGEIAFYPDSFKKNMAQWLENLEDWCISRQIWWGHRIPVWYCERCDNDNYIVSLEKPDQCPHCEHSELIQDPDTFDTWFSSGQWPYTTLGYPEKTDYKIFFPTDTMVMARDILFFWASRMIMMSLYRTGNIPFKNLYFTGLIRDKEGHKLSKSRGNGVDVLEMIDSFGADAVRMSVIAETTPGIDARVYEEKIRNFRNFVNKLWNISRYCIGSSEHFTLRQKIASEDIRSAADAWILEELQTVIGEVNRFLESKLISLAAEKLRQFTWNAFADWYVEIHKLERNDAVLGYTLDTLLKLWHPFMPFVTEAIFQSAHTQNKRLLMMAQWPSEETFASQEISGRAFERIIALITDIRNIRSVYRIDPVRKVDITLIAADTRYMEHQRMIIQRLARVENIHIHTEDQAPRQSAYAITEGIKVYIHLEGILDIEKERARLEKEKHQTENYIARLESQLNNEHFRSKAPGDIIRKNEEELQKAQEKISDMEKYLQGLLA